MGDSESDRIVQRCLRNCPSRKELILAARGFGYCITRMDLQRAWQEVPTEAGSQQQVGGWQRATPSGFDQIQQTDVLIGEPVTLAGAEGPSLGGAECVSLVVLLLEARLTAQLVLPLDLDPVMGDRGQRRSASARRTRGDQGPL